MAEAKKSKRSLEALNKRYQTRVTMVKHGKIAYNKNDFNNAVRHYRSYLEIIAQTKDTDENGLRPELFDKKKEASEMLLISQVYWDLVKIFDLLPSFKNEFSKSLSRFVLFSKGMPYQVICSELLRKHIERKKCRNTEEFRSAFSKIGVASKKCYVATMCYGEDHSKTQGLRKWRNKLIHRSPLYWPFISFYYEYSPTLVAFIKRRSLPALIIHRCILLPIINLISWLIK